MAQPAAGTTGLCGRSSRLSCSAWRAAPWTSRASIHPGRPGRPGRAFDRAPPRWPPPRSCSSVRQPDVGGLGRYIAALPIWPFVRRSHVVTRISIGDLAVTAALGLLLCLDPGSARPVHRGQPRRPRTWIAASVLLAIASCGPHHPAGRLFLILPVPAPRRSAVSTPAALWPGGDRLDDGLRWQRSRHRQRRQPRARRRRTETAAHLGRAADAAGSRQLIGPVVSFGSAVLFVVGRAGGGLWCGLTSAVRHHRAPVGRHAPEGLRDARKLASARAALGQAVRADPGGERMLVQLSQQGRVTRALTTPTPALGTLARASDTVAAIGAVAILAARRPGRVAGAGVWRVPRGH